MDQVIKKTLLIVLTLSLTGFIIFINNKKSQELKANEAYNLMLDSESFSFNLDIDDYEIWSDAISSNTWPLTLVFMKVCTQAAKDMSKEYDTMIDFNNAVCDNIKWLLKGSWTPRDDYDGDMRYFENPSNYLQYVQKSRILDSTANKVLKQKFIIDDLMKQLSKFKIKVG